MRSVARFFVLQQLIPALVILGLVVPTTGCNQSPTEIVGKVVAGLQDVQEYVQQAKQLAVVYQQLDPPLAQEVGEYAALADQNLASLITIGNNYLAKPSADTYQALLNGVDAFVQSVDQKVLLAAKISNPQTQQKVLTIIALAATGAHIVLGLLEQNANKKQLKAMPKAGMRVSFEEVRPYLDRTYAAAELTKMGYEGDKTLERVGL